MTEHEQKILDRANRFVESLAYWISPDGEIYDVGTRHTDFILSNPTLFKLTQEQVDNYRLELSIQKKRENKDLESLMVNDGWIRMRQYVTKNNQGWVMEVYKLDNRTVNNIFDFTTTVYEFKKIKTGEYPKHIDVKYLSQVKIISIYRYVQSKDWNQAITYITDFNEIIQGTGALYENRNELKNILCYNSFLFNLND